MDDRPASSPVFAIPEVLETILSGLPMRDLLLAQRVSRTFKAVIDHSPTLQRRLFLAPVREPSTDSTKTTTTTPTTTMINPLFEASSTRSRIPAFLCKDGQLLLIERPTVASNPLEIGWSLSPSSSSSSPEAWHPPTTPSPEVHVRLCTTAVAQGLGLIDARARAHVRGSWRRMFLSQPPRPVSFRTLGLDGRAQAHACSPAAAGQARLRGKTFGPTRMGELISPAASACLEHPDADGTSSDAEVDVDPIRIECAAWSPRSREVVLRGMAT